MSKSKPPMYGLHKKFTRRPAQEFLDFDYLDELDEESLKFLDQFSREYYQNSFRNTRSDIHRNQTLRRKCYAAENARNRDIWNQSHRLPYNEDTDQSKDDNDNEE